MAEGTGGVDLGGIRYAIQLDLAKLSQDLDEAERLVRQRAERMNQALGSITPRVPGGAATNAGANRAAAGTAANVAAAASPVAAAAAVAAVPAQTQADITRAVNQSVTTILQGTQQAVADAASQGVQQATQQGPFGPITPTNTAINRNLQNLRSRREKALAGVRVRSQRQTASQETANMRAEAAIERQNARRAYGDPNAIGASAWEDIPEAERPGRQSQQYNLRARQQRQLQALANSTRREVERQTIQAQRQYETENPIQGPKRPSTADINRNLQRNMETERKAREQEELDRVKELEERSRREYGGLGKRLRSEREIAGTNRTDVSADDMVSGLRPGGWWDRFRGRDSGGGTASAPPARSGGGGGGGGGGSGGTGSALHEFAKFVEPSRDVSSLLRVGAAIAGVGLGINVAAGLARELNKTIGESVGTELNLERAVRASTAAFGQQASAAARVSATSFTANPETRGTQAEYIQGVSSLQALGTQYGITQAQATQLADAAGRLAKIHNVDLSQALNVVHQMVTGNVSAGEQYGIQLLDQEGRVVGLNHSYDTLITTYGRLQTTQQMVATVLASVDRQQQNVATSAGNLSTALDELGRKWEHTQQLLGAQLANPAEGIVRGIENVIGGFNEQEDEVARKKRVEELRNQFLAAQGYNISPQMGPIPSLMRDAQGNIVGTGDARKIADEARKRAEEIVELERTRNQQKPAPTVPYGPEQPSPYAIDVANREEIQKALSTVQGREAQFANQVQAIQGPFGVRAANAQQLGAMSQAQANQDVLARYRQKIATLAPNLSQEEINQLAQQARETAPGQFDVRQQAQSRLAEFRAQAASENIQRAQQDAQSQVQVIQLQNEERRLQAQRELNQLKERETQLDQQIAPLTLAQANLQDRITVAQRNNLDLQEALLRAQQAALTPANRVSDLQYGTQEALLQVQAYAANRIRGVATGPAPNMKAITSTLVQNALAGPQAELDVLHANRQVELAQRGVRASELSRQLGEIPLEREQRAIQDQLIPLEAARRLEEARTAAVERRLTLEELQRAPALVQAQLNANAVSAASLAADVARRRAENAAAGLPTDQTPAEVAKAALDSLSNPSIPVGSIPQSTAIGSVSGGSIGQVTVQINGSTNMGPADVAMAVAQGLLKARIHASGRPQADVAGTR